MSISVSPSSSTSPSYLFSEVFGLLVNVIRCKDLVSADLNGKSDPFVEITVGGKTVKTKIQKKTLDPNYNEIFNLIFESSPSDLEITVWDWSQMTKNEKIGYVKFPLSSLNATNHFSYSGWIKLGPVPGVEKSAKLSSWGEIEIRIDSNSIPHVIGRHEDDDESVGTVAELISLIDLEIIEGKNLKSKDIFHKSSAFAVVSFGLQSFRTAIAVGPNAQFHQFCPLWVRKESEEFIMKFSVFDHEKLGKPKLVGNSFIRPKDFLPNKDYDLELPLIQDDAHTDAELADLMIKVGGGMEKEKVAEVKSSSSSSPSSAPPLSPSSFDSKLGSLHVKLHIRPREEVENKFYLSLFNQYDEQKKGIITEGEVSLLLTSFNITGLTEDLIHEVFTEADEEKKGNVTFDQMKSIFHHPKLDSLGLSRKLHSLMINGEDAVENLMMKNFLYKPIKDTGAKDKDKKNNDDDVESPDNDNTKILVQDRESGLLVQEEIPTYIKTALKLMYRTGLGRGATHSEAIRKTMRSLTLKQGIKMNTEKSQKNIPDFIKTHKLNVNEIEKPLTEYKNFNEFFYRKLRVGARTCSEPDNSSIATSPADCRAMVFDSLEEGKELWIKGKNFNISNLIGKWDTDGTKSKMFQGASMMIARLAPQDYHRFHSPVTGKVGKRFLIEGDYNTVNPLAIRRAVDVYTENKRCICPIQTEEFGLVLLIAVAATMVGSINFSEGFEDLTSENVPIKKFQDFGYFAFGGSTTLVVFQPGAIVWDEDIRKNSKNRLETLCKVGMRVGRATGKHQ